VSDHSITNTPSTHGYRMPAEWAPHSRTWMELPPDNATFSPDIDAYRDAWMAVTTTVARFEPVTLITNRGDAPAARRRIPAELSARIDVHEWAIDDSWFRDSGPTFLVNDDGQLGATHWRFNAWGDRGFSSFEHEQHVGATAAGLAGAEVFPSRMVNEGGGIHVDGEGTVLVTETVQLDPDRNPGWSHGDVEAELRAYLGVERVLWLPRGLTRDYDNYGTRGHVDIVAAFVRPGVVVAHRQPDPAHPDHEVCHEIIALLRASRDAGGRQLEVVEIDAPTVLTDDHGWVDYSYINHYVCNGGVVLCSFDDPRDADAAATLARLYPDREVVLVDARRIFECGGGIHCITQQQPAV